MPARTSVWPLGRFDPAHVIELTKQEGIIGVGRRHHAHRAAARSTPTSRPSTRADQQRGHRWLGHAARRRSAAPRSGSRTSTGTSRPATARPRAGPDQLGAGLDAPAAPDCVGPPHADGDGPHHRRRRHRAARRRGRQHRGPQLGCRCSATGTTTTPTPRPSCPGAGCAPATSAASRTASLFIASRKRDLIIRGGENIYPFEIENRLDEHAEVVEAAVYGIDDPVLRPGGEGGGRRAPGADAHRGRACARSAPRRSRRTRCRRWSRSAPSRCRAPRSGKVMKHVLAGEGENIFEGE